MQEFKANKKSAQDIQDEIFRKMPTDKKLEVGAKLWLLGKELDKARINYGINRSQTSTNKSS